MRSDNLPGPLPASSHRRRRARHSPHDKFRKDLEVASMDQVRSTALYLTAAIFAIQLLPHWWTGLSVSSFQLLYTAIAVFAFGLICLATAVIFVFWLRESDRANRELLGSVCLTFALMAGSAVLLTVVNGLLARGLPTGSFARRFDSQAWIQSPHYVPHDITPRQKMLGDMIRTVVRGGTRQQIEAQLGRPIPGRLTEDDWTYETGPQRDSLFPFDNEWISIWFDESGRVKRWQVWSD